VNLTSLIKREITIIVLSIVLVILGLIAVSYALFFDVDSGGTNSISFGNISMELCANDVCNQTVENLGNIIGWEDDGSGTAVPTVLYPMSESDALNNSTPYKFVLTNTGDYDLLLTIKLEPDTSFDLVNEWPSYSDYSSDYANINIAFGEDNLTPTSMAYSSLTNYEIADNIVLEAGDSKIYNLYAWVDENAENSAQGTYFVTAISVVGEYIPES